MTKKMYKKRVRMALECGFQEVEHFSKMTKNDCKKQLKNDLFLG